MIGSIYNGMSGLLAFSQGLNTISSNVSNMNTPGYKSSELQFLDVFYKSQYSSLENGDVEFYQTGGGVGTGSTTTSFNDGEVRNTGNDLDVAIQGNGFLVLNKNTETFYSRAGQFEFNDEGFLVSRLNGARVQTIDEVGRLFDINQNDFLLMPQESTSTVSFTGILSTGTLNSDGDPIHQVQGVTVIDSLGDKRILDIDFELTDITNIEWSVRIIENSVTIATGTVGYQPSGQPNPDANSFNFILSAKDGTESEIKIFMGDDGSADSSTSSSFGSSSSLASLNIDGFSSGSIVSSSFDEFGILNSEYSNGETQKNGQLALASFLQLQDLEQQGGGMFSSNGLNPTLGHADDGVMGKFIPRSVELSNVELTQQFGDLIIVQRGYQASSQILTVSNEMLQQLIEMRGR